MSVTHDIKLVEQVFLCEGTGNQQVPDGEVVNRLTHALDRLKIANAQRGIATLKFFNLDKAYR